MLKCARMNTVGEIIIQYRNSYINKHQHTKGNTPNVFSKCVQQSLVFTVLYRHTIYYYCTKNISSKNVEVLRRHIDTPSIITVQNISSKNVEVLRRHIDTPSITNDQHLVSPDSVRNRVRYRVRVSLSYQVPARVSREQYVPINKLLNNYRKSQNPNI